MPDRERKKQKRQGPSSQPVDEGLEGAIFDERDTGRDTGRNDAADIRDLDAAATGKGGVISSRSGEKQGSGDRARDSGDDSGEETPPEAAPS